MDDNSGDYQDQMVNCRDCGAEFVFSAGEQAFFAQKGFAAPPKRCKTCRERKKAGGPDGGGGGGGGGGRYRSSGPVEVQEKPARTFRPRDGGGGGGHGGGGHSGGGDYGGGSRGGGARVQVTCSTCGVATTVPFEPSAGRPVFCKDCYQKNRR